MQLHIFNVPVFDGEHVVGQLNQLLSSHRIAEIRKELISDGANSFWSVFVTSVSLKPAVSMTNKGRIDYREILSPEDFEVYSRLRTLRKELSERDGAPPYTIFTNEQIAEMSKLRIQTVAELRNINGVDAVRAEKYGELFLLQVTNTADKLR